MNVCFIIYSRGKASGGHYHSCDHISRAVSQVVSGVRIVTIGPVPSPVLEKNPFFEKHLNYVGPQSLLRINAYFKALRASFNLDLLHCFDTESMNRVIMLPSLRRTKIVLTKCGGPNPNRQSWQYADSMVLFSYENFTWFKNNPNYAEQQLHLISNRATEVKVMEESERVEHKPEGFFSFMRISRLGGAYEKTLWDTYRLVERLHATHKVMLYVIGRIQDKERFAEFEGYAKKNALPIVFITDERASKASQFLYLADCVIGTGRSFMEACSLGIPSLTPASNHDYPVLIHKGNFLPFFKTNFSERNVAPPESIIDNEADIERLIESSSFHNKIANETHELFQQHFDTKQVGDKYIKVYRDCLDKTKLSRFSLIQKNLLYIARDLFVSK